MASSGGLGYVHKGENDVVGTKMEVAFTFYTLSYPNSTIETSFKIGNHKDLKVRRSNFYEKTSLAEHSTSAKYSNKSPTPS